MSLIQLNTLQTCPKYAQGISRHIYFGNKLENYI